MQLKKRADRAGKTVPNSQQNHTDETKRVNCTPNQLGTARVNGNNNNSFLNVNVVRRSLDSRLKAGGVSTLARSSRSEGELQQYVCSPLSIRPSPCGPKPIRTISEFLELISKFEFDFRRCGIFLNDSNFWCVQSSITHNVAVHVHVLWPVCAHTIPFRMLWCP